VIAAISFIAALNTLPKDGFFPQFSLLLFCGGVSHGPAARPRMDKMEYGAPPFSEQRREREQAVIYQQSAGV
jgi:hypothetical protein